MAAATICSSTWSRDPTRWTSGYSCCGMRSCCAACGDDDPGARPAAVCARGLRGSGHAAREASRRRSTLMRGPSSSGISGSVRRRATARRARINGSARRPSSIARHGFGRSFRRGQHQGDGLVYAAALGRAERQTGTTRGPLRIRPALPSYCISPPWLASRRGNRRDRPGDDLAQSGRPRRRRLSRRFAGQLQRR